MRLLILLLLFFSTAQADKSLKGWDLLVETLIEDGLDPSLVKKTFRDRRMPARELITFNLVPRESRDIYRKHNSRTNRLNALKFYRNHKTHFQSAAKLYDLDPSVILAILQVETKCGLYTGKSRVIHRLSRLASAVEDDTVDRNFKRLNKKDKTVTRADVKARGEWLFETFYPHVAASFYLAKELGVEPLELRGSGAGAVGLGQFLPGNYFIYGKDGNNNQLIEPMEPVDSIYSVASFLDAHGWSTKDKKDVIRSYNNSDPYIETVLAMARKLKPHL